MIKDEELHCIVCFDFPTGGEIYQCKHGHLLCKSCHQQVVEGEKAQCPNCRVRLSRENPSRNRIAEMVLSSVMVDCNNVGCTMRHKFADAEKHEKEECGFRAACCKWEPLGCDWKGVHNDLAAHEQSCKIKDKSAKKLLKLCVKREEQTAERVKAMEAKYTQQSAVMALLSGRCRDIVMRDVHIETDGLTGVRCSKTFTALGMAWELVLETPACACQPDAGSAPQRVGIHLRVVSTVKRKLILKVAVLKAPGLLDELPPSIHKLTFKRRKKKSETMYLPFETDRVETVLSTDMLSFRIGLVDVSNGRVSRGFTSLNEGGAHAHSDSSSSDLEGHSYDEEDDYDIDIDEDDDSPSELEYDSGDPLSGGDLSDVYPPDSWY